MRHAQDDLLDAEIAAALDDRVESGISVSPPSSENRLVPVKFRSQKVSKSSASMSFIEDGAADLRA